MVRGYAPELKNCDEPRCATKVLCESTLRYILEHFDLTKMLQDITPQSNISRWANRTWSPQIGGKYSAHDIILTE